MAFLADKDVLVLGPGLSQHPETMELVRRMYGTWDKTVVVDADGINAFQGCTEEIGKGGGRAVFTPHPGELGRLTGLSPAAINADRPATAQRFADRFGVNLVLKGAPTVVAGAGGLLHVNPTGNASLAKGGSGDILTGFIGGLASQGYSPLESALLGVYLHGYMADRWVEQGGTEMDLLAGGLLPGIGSAIEEVRDGTERLYFEESL
jgi:NAD(P)H-hydrate epimerase